MHIALVRMKQSLDILNNVFASFRHCGFLPIRTSYDAKDHCYSHILLNRRPLQIEICYYEPERSLAEMLAGAGSIFVNFTEQCSEGHANRLFWIWSKQRYEFNRAQITNTNGLLHEAANEIIKHWPPAYSLPNADIDEDDAFEALEKLIRVLTQ